MLLRQRIERWRLPIDGVSDVRPLHLASCRNLRACQSTRLSPVLVRAAHLGRWNERQTYTNENEASHRGSTSAR